MYWRIKFQIICKSSQTKKGQVFIFSSFYLYRVVVVLENRIYVYNFADLRLIDAIDTCFNPKGICALSPDPSISVLATPEK